jgi:hypothetical protein
LFLFFKICRERDKKCVITEGENVPHLLVVKPSTFSPNVFCSFSKSLFVIAGNSLFSFIFKVFQTFGVVVVDYLRNSPERSQVA